MRFTSAKFFALIFSIIIVVSVVVLPTFIHAADETAMEQEALGKTSSLELIDCEYAFILSGVDCLVPQVTYFLLYVPAMGILMLTGYIFDFVLALSIDKFFIEQDFVNTLWGVIRDFTNMIFIFILLYTGVQTMFGFGKWQSTIIKVVIIALLVNFSMFFTKVVIDAGNILAVGIYQGIGVTKVAGIDRPHKTAAMTPKAKNENFIPERTVSATLVNALAPQQFSKLSADNKSGAATIFVISAIVCAYAAFIFAKASLLFIGRIIAFWFLMAVSPFALISMTLPKGNIWSWWTNALIKQSFVAPVFLILVYFIMTAIKSLDGVLQNGADVSKSFFDQIVISVVVTAMIMFALKQSIKYTEDMAGKFGGIGADALGKVMSSFPMGMAGGLVLGGGAKLLRSQIGARAGKVLGSDKLQQMSSNPNSALTRFAGRTLHGVAEKAHTSSFDARNTDTMKWALKAVKDPKSGLGVGVNLGTAGGKGGYKSELEKIEKEAKAQAEKMKVTDAGKEKFGPGYLAAKENEAENKETLAEANTAHKNAEKQARETKEWKEYEKQVEVVKTSRSGFKSTEGNLVKQIEDLKKKQKEALYKEEEDLLQEQIKHAEENLKQEKEKFENEEKKLADLENTYKATKEDQLLSEAKIAQEMAKGTYERGQKIIKDVEKWENEENMRRREYSAENSMNSWFSSSRYFVPKDDRMSVIKKVRKGDSKEKKKKEKFLKDLMESAEAKVKKEKKPEAKEEEAES